jgi:Ni,Fe-hydrogenase III large subunit/Ni,Fe-hydrogenase III component G
MTDASFATVGNGAAIARSRVPQLTLRQFRDELAAATSGGCRVSALFGDAPDGRSTKTAGVELYAVLADAPKSLLRVARTRLEGDQFPSMTPACPQVHLFEREIAEQFGVKPEGHPWFKPVRFHSSYRPDHDAWGRPTNSAPVVGVTDYYRVDGEQIHEVAVGPVHAGVIEPGHFRFQCNGEHVFHLEISLGYQHRGAEQSLTGGPDKRTLHTISTVAGDTSIGHGLAYCQAVEALAGCKVSSRAEAIRGIALELERLANHTGDLGALAGDVGFLPTASYCGRLRGDFLNLSALLCGNRFGRSLLRPGGVRFDYEETRVQQSLQRISSALADVKSAAELMFNAASVQARFEETGEVSRENCLALGLVGPAARACGVDYDVRRDFPAGIFRSASIPVSTWTTGDVFARTFVRWLEIQRSAKFVQEMLVSLPEGALETDAKSLKADHFVVSLVEGWRGEICHVALTDDQGRFARYKIIDPSFHNWMGLAVALRDQQISDFPLCNKSFNLSYCGHDL